MNRLLLLLISSLGVGCAHPSHVRQATTADGKPAFIHVHDDDAEMSRAVRRARKTVGNFIAAVQHPTATERDFEVKKPFVYPGGVEHIWLSDVQFHGGHFHGKVDNKPKHLADVKLGDRVSVNVNEITDWAYVDDGVLVGGYTIRILVKDLAPEQKKAFEAEAKYRVTKD